MRIGDRTIFHQRPLKPAVLGQCGFFPEEKRAYKALPSFQRYRLYQEAHNLTWSTPDEKNELIDHPHARDEIITLLRQPTAKNGSVTFGKMKKILKNLDLMADVQTFNFESEKRKGLQGDLTANALQQEDRVGPQWHEWSLDKQDAFVSLLLSDLEDDQVHARLIKEYGLTAAAAELCMQAPLPEGTASSSAKAARLLLDLMHEENLRQPDAIERAAQRDDGFINPYTRSREGEILSELPYYGDAFADGRHIIPGTRRTEDQGNDLKYYGGITNPTVHIGLNQIRWVTNSLIKRYKHPVSIGIELARDLPMGKDGRSELEKEQNANQARNEKHDEALKEHGQRISRDNRLRLRLWEELEDHYCPFSGKKISKAELFSDEIEIEHLLPYSQTLDDSYANKVICFREANRLKGNRTPYEAFSDSQIYSWNEIYARAQRLPESKKWRFEADAMDKWHKGEGGDFTSRHLNDTRYIGRLAREYLECICDRPRIDVVTGRLTSILRSHWGLNKVLGDDGQKNRDNHRHHAVDAIVIALTTKGMIQKVAKLARQGDDVTSDRLFTERLPDPWPNYRQDIQERVGRIIISHRAKRKWPRPGATTDRLHEDTAYGLVRDMPAKKGFTNVVTRWSIDKFEKRKNVEAIRDEHLQGLFLAEYDRAVAAGEKVVDVLKKFAQGRGIRRLRMVQSMRDPIILKNHGGKAYKALQGGGNWATEIYEMPPSTKKAGTWVGVVVSTYQANQAEFRPGMTARPHPAARLVMRLQIDDCLQIEENGRKRLVRVQKMSKGQVIFADLHEANVAARDSNKEDSFSYIYKTAGSLQKCKARRVHISPTGQISFENRRRRNGLA